MPQPSLSDEECQAALDALAANGGNQCHAASALGMSRGAFQHRLRTARDRLAWKAREGHAPGHFDSGVAPGYLMGKVTVQRGSDGAVERTWERQSPEAEEKRRALIAAAAAMGADLARAEPVAGPQATQDQLCNLYTYSDFHLGCLAWSKEGGDDWDLNIAEHTLLGSFQAMIDQSPAAHTAVINLQGDFLHTDGLLPVTPMSKHILDADGRFSKIVAVAIRSIRSLVAMALAKHETVHLILLEGNHDETSSVWLRLMFQALYENEPRVVVNHNELPFYALKWGETMLGFHHGHKVKNEQLPLLFAAQFSSMWGETKKREIHCGHRHHRDEKEYNGATVVQHPTIAARDAYAARGGWIADRSVQSITYHRAFGQVGRVSICPEMLRPARETGAG